MTYHTGNQLINSKIIFEKAHLREGQHIADFGCGRTGNIIFPASVILGEHGLMYAVDIMKDVLSEIQKRAALESLHNIYTIWSNIEQYEATNIPEASLDAVLLVNTLFHTKQPEDILHESLRLLKPKARIVVVDWTHSDLPFGPNKDHLVDFPRVVAWASKNGLTLQDDFQAGPHHRGLVLYRNI